MSRHVYLWKRRNDLPKFGRTSDEVLFFCRVRLAFRRMDTAERSCSRIIFTSTTSRWPIVPQFCLSRSSLFLFRVTCGDPLDCCLCALLSVLRFVTASWLKVKESIISLRRRSIQILELCVWKRCGYNHGSLKLHTATVPAVHRQDFWIGSKDADFSKIMLRLSRCRSEWQKS